MIELVDIKKLDGINQAILVAEIFLAGLAVDSFFKN